MKLQRADQWNDSSSSVEKKYVSPGHAYMLYARGGGFREVMSGGTRSMAYGCMSGEVCLMLRAITGILLIDHGSGLTSGWMDTEIVSLEDWA